MHVQFCASQMMNPGHFLTVSYSMHLIYHQAPVMLLSISKIQIWYSTKINTVCIMGYYRYSISLDAKFIGSNCSKNTVNCIENLNHNGTPILYVCMVIRSIEMLVAYSRFWSWSSST